MNTMIKNALKKAAKKKSGAVLITGAADRLGLEIAKMCVGAGFGVIIHYRSSAEPAKTFFDNDKYSGKVNFIHAELTANDAAQKIFSDVKELNVNLVGLINNAAIFEKGNLSDLEHFEKMMTTNMFAPLRLATEFAKVVKEGWIINITDSRIHQLNKNYQNYRMSKQLLDELTRQLAFLYMPKIRVNAVAPGPVLKNRDGENIKILKNGCREVCNAIKFLIDDEEMTGNIIAVDDKVDF